MPKSTQPEEVQVLRFFEESPIEKAELLFNIVGAKMRERLAESTKQAGEKAGRANGKRQKRRIAENPAPEEGSSGESTEVN